jgi:hypothetical protein
MIQMNEQSNNLGYPAVLDSYDCINTDHNITIPNPEITFINQPSLGRMKLSEND